MPSSVSFTTSDPRPFLSLPDVIRERIYFFVLTPDLDPRTPWITPLPILRHTPKKLPSASPPRRTATWSMSPSQCARSEGAG